MTDLAALEALRAQRVGLAYRMLGDLARAEDTGRAAAIACPSSWTSRRAASRASR